MTKFAIEKDSNRSAFARDPQKNDVSLFTTATINSLGNQRYCVISHHDRNFEKSESVRNNADHGVSNYRKTQHFINGKTPGASTKNLLLYGEKDFMENARERSKPQNEDEKGFLYGTSAVKRSERIPARRPNNKLMLEEKTRNDQFTKQQKLAAYGEDNYLARHYEAKAREKMFIVNEKKKDLKRLKQYNPWGKPGGGAPRGYKNNEVEANLTKELEKLKKEDNFPKESGGGGGSPIRTTSGHVVAPLKMNPELRFQPAQYNTDTDPQLRYKANTNYGKELDVLIQDASTRKSLEKKKNVEDDLRQIESYPFTNEKPNQQQMNDSNVKKPLFEDKVFDPWGKGFGGIPERKPNGKILRKYHGFKQDSQDRPWLLGGISTTENVKKKMTLSNNPYGQPLVRDFSPKEISYDPWGRPGAGAPLKDQGGRTITNTNGKLTSDNMVGSALVKRDPIRKKEYLKTLEHQRHEVEIARDEEKNSYSKPSDVEVASWVRQGKVGQPTYDNLTKEIRANPKSTSDVTREKLQIRRLKNDNSKVYYEDLQEMADERNKRRQMEKSKERQLSYDHVSTMNGFWGRPGAGAPVIKDNPKKRPDGFLPMDSLVLR